MKQNVVGELEQLRASARERVDAAGDQKALEDLRVGLLGKKGELTGVLRQLGSLPAAERAAAGAAANQLKDEIFGWIAERQAALEAKRHTALGDTEWVDALLSVADGADLFIIECFAYSGELPGHITWDVLKPRLPDLRARRIMLTHMNPVMLANLDEVRAAGVFPAEDGAVIEI